MISSILDFLFPRRSLTGEEGAWVTPDELEHLTAHPQFYDVHACRELGMPELDSLFAVSTYRDCPLLKRAIHTLKFKRLRSIGGILSKVMAESIRNNHVLDVSACLCPVPLHWTRRFHRGFNQAEILARGISCAQGLPMINCLRRMRPTGFQSHRTRSERLHALQGAFRISQRTLPVSVVLVDDVCTTGATLRECARVLKAAGVASVSAIVCAHDFCHPARLRVAASA